MLKHVQHTSSGHGRRSVASDRRPLTPCSDAISLSSVSLSVGPMGCSSRVNSCTSLVETTPTAVIKVFARCLRPDVEYKTLSISYTTTCREVVHALLNKFRMKNRDPRLFHLTMEVGLRSTKPNSMRTIVVLDDSSRPAVLQSCQPRGDCRFTLQMRRGGLVKVCDSVLLQESQYKSLLISEQTTASELVQLLLHCYNNHEPTIAYSIYVISHALRYERQLHPNSYPLRIKQAWPPNQDYQFVLRRNIDPHAHLRALRWSPTSSLELSSCSESSTGSCSGSSASPSPTPSFRMSRGFNEYENFFYI